MKVMKMNQGVCISDINEKMEICTARVIDTIVQVIRCCGLATSHGEKINPCSS